MKSTNKVALDVLKVLGEMGVEIFLKEFIAVRKTERILEMGKGNWNQSCETQHVIIRRSSSYRTFHYIYYWVLATDFIERGTV